MSSPVELLNAYLDGKELSQDEARLLSDWAAADFIVVCADSPGGHAHF